MLSDQHEAILAAIGALRHAVADGGNDVADLVSGLVALLAPHTLREEVGIFTQLRFHVRHGYVERFEHEHEEIDRLLEEAGGDRSRITVVLDMLHEHIRDEESDMYPAARQLLDPAAWSDVDTAVAGLTATKAA